MKARLLLGLDAVAVIGFVALGRDSHNEANSLSRIASTATPFLIAVAVGWLVSRSWNRPVRLTTGVIVAAVTVGLGMLLRRSLGSGTAPTFIVVATGFMMLTMTGWRLVVMALFRMRTR